MVFLGNYSFNSNWSGMQLIVSSHKSHIDFKILLLTLKILHNLGPSYFAELIHIHPPSRTVRSSSTIQLFTPSASLTTMGSGAFSRSAPSLWNSLPPDIHTSDTVSTFKSRLKTHWYRVAYSVSDESNNRTLAYSLSTLLHYSHPWSSTLPNPAQLTSCMVRTTESEFCAGLAPSYLLIFPHLRWIGIQKGIVFVVLLLICEVSLSALKGAFK